MEVGSQQQHPGTKSVDVFMAMLSWPFRGKSKSYVVQILPFIIVVAKKQQAKGIVCPLSPTNCLQNPSFVRLTSVSITVCVAVVGQIKS